MMRAGFEGTPIMVIFCLLVIESCINGDGVMGKTLWTGLRNFKLGDNYNSCEPCDERQSHLILEMRATSLSPTLAKSSLSNIAKRTTCPSYRREWCVWHLSGHDDESLGYHDVITTIRSSLFK
jgi:hypothetical protein